MRSYFLLVLNLLLYLSIVSISYAQTTVVAFGTINPPETKIFQQAKAILTEAFKRNGYDFRLKKLPGERALISANSGAIDGDAFRISGLEKKYPNLVQVLEPVIIIEQSVWSKRDIKVDGFKSLYKYSLVYERGLKSIEKHKDKFKEAYVVNNTFQAFNVLQADRADLTILSRASGDYYLRRYGWDNSGIKVLSPPLTKLNLYPYIHKKHKKLAFEIARTLKEMKTDGTYGKIVDSFMEP